MSLEGTGKRVAVAMSGGVDSSVAAGILVQQGYEVTGLMMRLWSEPGGEPTLIHNRCCTPDQMADARRVADVLNIPFYVLDVQDLFKTTVVDFFVEEHRLGRTPNPCIECNRHIRFGYLLSQALSLGANFLATGHYARVTHGVDGYRLLKAVDSDKDQSYVLYLLSQEQLGKVRFPVGDLTKADVRAMAESMGLPVAAKSESMDLCFLRDGDYRRFLAEHAPDLASPGPIIDTQGRNVGQHTGLPSYTIGQRKGLGVAAGTPLYVLDKESSSNALIVGPREALARRELRVRQLNWVSGDPPEDGQQVEVKIRYRARTAPARLCAPTREQVMLAFDEPVFGATPGQGAVFYVGDCCLGGGIIDEEVRK
jgi:tRNA-uridine 2-sulfurtransferase